MTSEEVGILIVLYAFAIIIVIQSARLWLAQRHIRHLRNRNAISEIETPPIKPMILDQKGSVPKASDDKRPINNPPTRPKPTAYRSLSILKRFYERLK